jgi:hypothetical protein
MEEDWFLAAVCTHYPRYVSLVSGRKSFSSEAYCVDQRAVPIVLDILTRSCGKRGRFWVEKDCEI